MVRTLLVFAVVVAVAWVIFVIVLFLVKPDTTSVKQAMRLLPDTVRLVSRLARDRSIPFRARLPVWLLLGYLAVPIDLVPDFLPVLGYADDVILVALVLRGLVRRAGPAKLEEHWPGDPEGLATLRRVLRVGEERPGDHAAGGV